MYTLKFKVLIQYGCSYFLEFILVLNSIILLMLGDIVLQCDVHVMTMSILRFVLVQSLEVAHRVNCLAHNSVVRSHVAPM
jgi:hypothetical protein